MRPLFHPPVGDITVEGILYALSDSVRAQILIGLVSSECGQICAAFANLTVKPLAKSTLSQHFRILREAGLIHSERRGVQLNNTLRCEELPPHLLELVQAILKAYATQIQLMAE
jgi:DNA-binding transcriptional ArsR family regulator